MTSNGPLHLPTDAPGPVRRWGDVRRLLAGRQDNLGDVLMCTPALDALREGGPPAGSLDRSGMARGQFVDEGGNATHLATISPGSTW